MIDLAEHLRDLGLKLEDAGRRLASESMFKIADEIECGDFDSDTVKEELIVLNEELADILRRHDQ